MLGLTFALFFAALALLLFLLNRYVLSWVTQAFTLSARVKRWAAVGLAASLVAMIGGRLLYRVWPGVPLSGLIATGSMVQLTVLLAAVLLLFADGALIARRLWQRRRQEPMPTVTTEAPQPEFPRRTFLGQAAAGSAFMIASSSSLYGALAGRHDYAIEDLPLRLPGLPRSLDGFTIAQLSDVHIGQFVGEAELAAAEDLLRRARPDLIVLTGDLIDFDARMAPLLGRFVRRVAPLAREGVVAITGNHDFYAGVDPTVAALRAGGAKVLRNQGLVIGGDRGFALLGVDDVWATRYGGGPDLGAAVASLPEQARGLSRILLCHNPSYFEDAAGEVALQLSGHTHGGQINPLVRPADWVLKNGWVAGSYDSKGSRLYVNRGFGVVGPPARLGAPPEVTRVVLAAG
ncbi:MAG TPA: metallophosphoesterase [Polyangiaceae bacterium]|nr:metallophosphoesterase [Polyangiaceae bacterium]